jgi:hypothetical protein
VDDGRCMINRILRYILLIWTVTLLCCIEDGVLLLYIGIEFTLLNETCMDQNSSSLRLLFTCLVPPEIQFSTREIALICLQEAEERDRR